MKAKKPQQRQCQSLKDYHEAKLVIKDTMNTAIASTLLLSSATGMLIQKEAGTK
jgi:hypothetical protein